MIKLHIADVQFSLSFINKVNYCAITLKKESSENEMRERQKEGVLSPPSAELHTPFCQDLLSSYYSHGMPCRACQKWTRLTVKVTLRGLRGMWACERGRLLHGRFKCFLLSKNMAASLIYLGKKQPIYLIPSVRAWRHWQGKAVEEQI